MVVQIQKHHKADTGYRCTYIDTFHYGPPGWGQVGCSSHRHYRCRRVMQIALRHLQTIIVLLLLLEVEAARLLRVGIAVVAPPLSMQ